MNIKDRLTKIKNFSNSISSQNTITSNNFHFDNDIVNNIIEEHINNFGNIIFVTDISINNNNVAKYFATLIKEDKSISVIDTTKEILNIQNNTINIIQEVSKNNILNIFEQMLFGIKSFILGIHIDSYENIIEKIKTILAINSNLTESNINILLNAANALIINIQIDNNGIFYVKNIDKIQSEDSKILLKNLYTFFYKTEIEAEIKKEETNKINKNDEISQIPSTNKIEKEIKINKQNSEEPPTEEKTKKINKYKLLKEKIKQKKQN